MYVFHTMFYCQKLHYIPDTYEQLHFFTPWVDTFWLCKKN